MNCRFVWPFDSQLRQLSRDVSELKSLVEKFLQPRIVFFVEDELKRRLYMKDSEQAVAALTEVDAKGAVLPTPAFDAPPAWAIDDPKVATLEPSADGLTCNVKAGLPGNANLSVSAAAGGKSYAGTLPVIVTPGDAASISISLGAPTPQ